MDVFISCKLISQVVIGALTGATHSRLENNSWAHLSVSQFWCAVCWHVSVTQLSAFLTPCFVPVVLCRCSSGWWDIILTHPATQTPPSLCVSSVAQAHTHTHTYTHLPIQRNARGMRLSVCTVQKDWEASEQFSSSRESTVAAEETEK